MIFLIKYKKYIRRFTKKLVWKVIINTIVIKSISISINKPYIWNEQYQMMCNIYNDWHITLDADVIKFIASNEFNVIRVLYMKNIEHDIADYKMNIIIKYNKITKKLVKYYIDGDNIGRRMKFM